MAEQEEILKTIGFTEGEIKVYYALFSLGETTVGPVSKKSRISHAKVYPIVNKLIEKGLASCIIKNGRKNFSVTNPNSILGFIDGKMRELEEKRLKIKEAIPHLLTKQNAQDKIQYSRVFEGFKGLRALFYELFTQNKGEILVFGLDELLSREGFISFFSFYHSMRKENKIKTKVIFKKEIKTLLDKKYETRRLFSKKDKVKYVNIIFPVGVFIFNEHVITIIFDDVVTAFDIKSMQNAERYRKFFYSIWDKN